MGGICLWLCVHQPFAVPVFLSSLKSRPWSDGRRPADSCQISQPHVPSFCFIFKNPSIGGKQLQRLHAVMQIWRMLFDLEDVVWCWGLVLRWSRLCGLFSRPGPVASLAGSRQDTPGMTPEACPAERGAVLLLNQLFPVFPSRLGKQVLSLFLKIYCYLLLTL